MKIAAIVLACIAGLFALVIAIGESGRDDRPMPLRILDECTKSYGAEGKQAIDACRLRMSVKVIEDGERRKSDETYRRLR